MNTIRFALVWLSYWFDWQPALTIVQPETFKRWRRQGWRLLWTPPAKPGRPPIPQELQALIGRMARENVTWGQNRIANELLLKLGLRVSPRTVRKYMPSDCGGGPGRSCPSQRWSTFIRNHAKGLVITGVTAAATRRAQVALVQFKQLIRSVFAKEPQWDSMPVPSAASFVVVRLDLSDGSFVAEPLNGVEGIRCVESSPPAGSRLRHQHFTPVARGRLAVKGEVRSVSPVGCGQALVCLAIRGVERDVDGLMPLSSRPWAA